MLRTCAVVALLCATACADEPKKSTATSERGTTTAPMSKDDDGTPKLSLPTELDRVAWRGAGFRLGLGLVYGEFKGLEGAPSGRLLGAQLHAGLRLDGHWSLMSTFQYARVSAPGGLSGLRFEGTIDPTWHVTPSFALAIGFGFGGIVEGRTGRPDNAPADLQASAINVSYTFPTPSPALPSCSGVGAAALARAEWIYVLGPRGAMNVALEVDGQYTQCVDDTGRVEPDTAQPIVRKQYWPHAGVTLAWGFEWR